MSSTTPEGRSMIRLMRDSTGVKRSRAGTLARALGVPTRAAPTLSSSSSRTCAGHVEGCLASELQALPKPPDRHYKLQLARKAKRAASCAKRATDAFHLAEACHRRCASMRPSSEPPAATRMEAIRLRVLQRQELQLRAPAVVEAATAPDGLANSAIDVLVL